MNKRGGLIMIAAAGVIAVTSVLVTAFRSLTALESTLFQLFSLGIGLLGSYKFGRESARDAARELVKPHARSAFRRLCSLYRSLSRMAMVIQEAREKSHFDAIDPAVLDRLEDVVTSQILTADDALEDWSDVVPEDVKELRNRLGGNDGRESKA